MIDYLSEQDCISLKFLFNNWNWTLWTLR